ncbi:MAG TPA: DMT family transporter [Deferrisomatales bacterium]|nr:DMT family transporter [Deferrisomatales bacterium]
METHRLPRTTVLTLLLLCVLWGGNLAAIKISARGVSPVAMAALRSLVAAACLWGWMRLRGVPVAPDRRTLAHGVVVGLLFGVEFCCIYSGLRFTLASRGYVFLYTQPFFTALGAHFLLRGDRLSPARVAGLLLAFAGVAVLFAGNWGETTAHTLPGDLLLLLGGALWGATTLYIKRFLVHRAVALQTLFYQLAFSAPILVLLSLVLEDRMWLGGSGPVFAALFYQCIVVAFLSYLVWFELIHRHPVSLLAAFTFFTPVFGALISGVAILGEPLTGTMMASLALVTAGMFLVNRPGREAARADVP